MTTEEKAALVEYAQSFIKHANLGENERPYFFGDYDEQELSLIKIALAALTAEPVGKFIQWDSGDEETGPEIEWVEANTKEAIPLYKCAPVAAPEGWRLVPVEPTDEMLRLVDIGPKSYKALLAAAPTPK